MRPGTNPDGTPQGPRSPLIIVSPFAKPGYTDTIATTFAGILAFVEKNFGLSPLGVNDAGAYAFTNAFNLAQMPLRSARMATRRVLPASTSTCPKTTRTPDTVQRPQAETPGHQ